jgi:hypothetical protein
MDSRSQLDNDPSEVATRIAPGMLSLCFSFHFFDVNQDPFGRQSWPSILRSRIAPMESLWRNGLCHLALGMFSIFFSVHFFMSIKIRSADSHGPLSLDQLLPYLSGAMAFVHNYRPGECFTSFSSFI